MLSELAAALPGGEDVKKEEQDPVLKEKATVPTGLLSIRVFDCTNLYLDKDIIPENHGLYTNITVGSLSKSTSIKSCFKKGKVMWDEVKNFSILVPNKISSNLNKVNIAVIGFDKQLPRPKYRMLGKVELHLHKMVKKQWSMDSFQIQNKKNKYAGDINIEFAFSYGSFGYGFSDQLQGKHANEMVEQSAFPKLDPPGTTFNTLGILSIPRKVPHPKFIPFKTKVTNLEPDISQTCGLRTINQDLFKKRPVLDQKLTKLKQQCAEYSMLFSRTKRIDYLRKLITDKEALVDQGSDFGESYDPTIDDPTIDGLGGALATFMAAGAPGLVLRGRDRNPHIQPSSTSLNDSDNAEDNREQESNQDDQPEQTLRSVLGNAFKAGLQQQTKEHHDESEDPDPCTDDVPADKSLRLGIMASGLKDLIKKPGPGDKEDV